MTGCASVSPGGAQDIEECKKIIIKRGEIFARNARQSRERIAAIGGPFIRDGAVWIRGSSLPFYWPGPPGAVSSA
jgi:translation initiation factor 2B subunit (eIF-2B alpha/beta/delta family)